MDLAYHDHGVQRVSKICQELREKAAALHGSAGQLHFDVFERSQEYMEVASFLDRANREQVRGEQRLERTLTGERERLADLKRKVFEFQD